MARFELIYLAAGFSRRFPGNKLLTDWRGIPLWRHGYEMLCQVQRQLGCGLTVVSQYDEILNAVPNIVCNRHPERGIASSLTAGLTAASEGDYAVFCTADQPQLQAETMCDFLQALAISGKGIGALSCGGEAMNPCAFSGKYRNELLSLTGDKGGKRVLRQHLEDVFLWEVSPEQVKDLDTAEAFYKNSSTR